MRKTKKDLIKEIEDLEKENEELERKNKELKQLLTKRHIELPIRTMHTDPAMIMAFGSAKISGYATVVNVPLDYFESAIRIFKEMDKSSKSLSMQKYQYIAIAVATDYPLMMGTYDKEKKEIAGIFIAPKVEPDD